MELNVFIFAEKWMQAIEVPKFSELQEMGCHAWSCEQDWHYETQICNPTCKYHI